MRFGLSELNKLRLKDLVHKVDAKFKIKEKYDKTKGFLTESYLHFNAIIKPKFLDRYRTKRDGFYFYLKKKRFSLLRTAFFVVFLLFAASKYSPTISRVNGTFSGVINANMNWSGVVYVSGDVIVSPGYTIRILPNTTIIFMDGDVTGSGLGKKSLTNTGDPANSKEYEVTHSSLSAKIIADSVVFTSSKEEKGLGDWDSLSLFSGSILNNSVVEYSRGGIITYGDVVLENVTSRYALWNCFESHGSTIKDSRASTCWNHCFLILDNSNISDSGASECNIVFGAYANSTVKNLFAVNYCTNFSGDFSYYADFKKASLLSGTKATGEGIFEGVKIYSCP